MIDVIDLRKNFHDLEVLKGINFKVEKGDIVAVIGPSGSGKSTFLRCLNCMEDPTSGKIIFNGVDIADMKVDINVHRRHMGMVFQHFNLFNNKTVLENIMLAPEYVRCKEAKKLKTGKSKKQIHEEVKNEAMELLKRIGLESKADVYPSKLSGGQKQRVAIAGVMAMHPKCIVMDEPTAMLDPHGRKSVIETAKKLNKEEGITVILITHYMEQVIEADRIFVMDDGKLVMEGTPKEVFSKVEKLKELRLDVPQATLVAHELQQRGIPLPDGILNNEELVDELCRLKSKM